MATRSIKLKLSLGNDGDGNEEKARLRKAVWHTHRLFNDGVAYYMHWLLLLRQRGLDEQSLAGMGERDRAIFATDHSVKAELLRRAREAQAKNGAPPHALGTDDEILQLFRSFYEEIVPSSIGKNGDANQIARNVQGILVDPNSVLGLGKSGSGRKAAYLSMPAGPERDRREGKHKSRRSGLDDTPRAKLKLVWRALPLFTAFNLTLPSWRRVTRASPKDVLTGHDRDMFQQSLERLKPWESWNLRVKAEHDKKQRLWDELRASTLTPEPEWFLALRRYEADREERLGRDAFRPEQPFRLGERAIRGWEELREKWLKLPKASQTEQELLRVLAEEQTEKRGRIGDASDFFRWLALPSNHALWSPSDRVRLHIELNEAERALAEAKLFARYTAPDPLDHPLWARSGHSGDSNIHTYTIQETDAGLKAKIRLLHQSPDGGVIERDGIIDVRPSGQWNRPQRGTKPPLRVVNYDQVGSQWRSGAKNEPDCTWVACIDPGTGEEIIGTLGGAGLQLERDDFRLADKRTGAREDYENALASGKRFPRAYLNITISLKEREAGPAHKAFTRPPAKEDEPRLAVDYQLDADKKKGRLEDVVPGGTDMTEGLRVMSVDLGIRQLAACSVFELVQTQTPGRLSIPVAGAANLFMEHRRSFLLRLPGEETTPEVERTRERIREKRLVLRAAVRRLSQLLSLGRLDDPKRKREELDKLRRSEEVNPVDRPQRQRKVHEILDPALLHPLSAMVDSPNDPRWPDTILEIHRAWERSLGNAISTWRSESRTAGLSPDGRGHGGLSFWHIEELEETRRLLNSWSCHSRDFERNPDGSHKRRSDGSRIPAVVRAKRTWGLRPGQSPDGMDIDARLLEHINNLKEDRLKQGADAIVMAALGFEYRNPEQGWQRAHNPCQLVIFEDLSRYRFKTDRPRRENSMLMKWSHREIPRTVAMQGELHGLFIGNVAAEFSSKFRASGPAPTPGIRCRKITHDDLQDPWFLKVCDREIEKHRLPRRPQPGDLIPWEGGESFCTLDAQGKLFTTHADLNAAQNLMRRFWRRYSETFRLSCRKAASTGAFVPKNLNKRLARALAYDFGEQALKLIPIDPDNIDQGCRAEPIPMREYRKLSGAAAKADSEESEAASDDFDAALERIAESRGETITFFRDPSGFVLQPNLWFPSKVYWGRVRAEISKRLHVASEIPPVAPDPDGEDDQIPM